MRSLSLNKGMKCKISPTYGNTTSTVKSSVCFHLDSLYNFDLLELTAEQLKQKTIICFHTLYCEFVDLSVR